MGHRRARFTTAPFRTNFRWKRCFGDTCRRSIRQTQAWASANRPGDRSRTQSIPKHMPMIPRIRHGLSIWKRNGKSCSRPPIKHWLPAVSGLKNCSTAIVHCRHLCSLSLLYSTLSPPKRSGGPSTGPPHGHRQRQDMHRLRNTEQERPDRHAFAAHHLEQVIRDVSRLPLRRSAWSADWLHPSA